MNWCVRRDATGQDKLPVDADILRKAARVEAKSWIAAVSDLSIGIPTLRVRCSKFAAGWQGHRNRVKSEMPCGLFVKLAHAPAPCEIAVVVSSNLKIT